MGGAVMLLIAVSAAFVSTSIANAGVTYGWTPDGGQGVKYIIQIPPGEVDQVVRSGEIASQIPREIRGHVTEVVIQIGNGSLPRITPNNLAKADYLTTPRTRSTNELANEDRSPMPIPAMNGMMRLSPIRNPDAATAMMKPAPQAGGMNLPGGLGLPSTTPSRTNTPMPSTAANNLQNGFGNAGRSLQQAARDSLNNAGDQIRSTANNAFQNTQSAINQTVDRMGQTTSSQLQAAAEAAARNGREATSGLFQPDDPRARLGQNSSAARDPQTSANNPYSRAATSASSTDSRDPRTNASSSANDPSGQDWYDLRNGSRRRPSTDPIDNGLANGTESRSPSLFENSNFGRMPSGLDTDPNRFAADSQRSNPSDTQSANARNVNTRQDNTQWGANQGSSTQVNSGNRLAADDNSNLDYDSRLTAAEARRLPPGGYSFDNEGYPIDRQGYRLNNYGQRTNENQTNRSSQSSFSQDRIASRDSNQSPNDANSFGRDNDPRYANTNTNSNGYNANNYSANGNQSNNGQSNTNQPNGYTNNNNNQLVQPPPANQYPGNQYPAGNQAGNFQNGPYPPGQSYQQPAQYQQVGQYPVSPTNPGFNPYTNLAATGAGPAGYPSLNDPRLISFNGQGIGNKPQVDPSNVSTAGGTAPTGLAGRDGQSSRDSLTTGSRDRFGSTLEDPDAVAAQPIFNGMLLLSVVTNIYLLFWLKNLRLQFRDTVASRRATNNSASVVAST